MMYSCIHYTFIKLTLRVNFVKRNKRYKDQVLYSYSPLTTLLASSRSPGLEMYIQSGQLVVHIYKNWINLSLFGLLSFFVVFEFFVE